MGELVTAAACTALPWEARRAWLAGLSETAAHQLLYDWSFWARREKRPPEGAWFCWLVIAGRGFGKTRTGAKWLRSLVDGPNPLVAPEGAPAHMALVADTFSDARDVMVEGESGVLACSPPDPARFRALAPTARLAQWGDGPSLRGRRCRAAARTAAPRGLGRRNRQMA